MKTCQCCGTSTDAATCPHCGEASWSVVEPAAVQFKGRGLMSDAAAAKFDPPAPAPPPAAEPLPVVAALFPDTTPARRKRDR